MNEHHLTVARTARFHTLGPLDETCQSLWVVCHGYGQLAGRFLRHFEAFHDGHRLIVAPEALNRFYMNTAEGGTAADARVGATWMTREDRLAEISDYVGYLDALRAHILGRVGREVPTTVLGFSQGTAAATRWVAHGSARPRRLILWAGAVPPELDASALERLTARTRLTAVFGDGDELIPSGRALEERQRLEEMGVRFDWITFPGGHTLHEETLRGLMEEWSA